MGITNLQDTIKQQDTSKAVKAAIIVPAQKIKSEEGAIIPKEAVSLIPLEPSIPVKNNQSPSFSTYILLGFVLVVILIAARYIKNKRKNNSNK